jgi:hypothetical protein
MAALAADAVLYAFTLATALVDLAHVSAAGGRPTAEAAGAMNERMNALSGLSMLLLLVGGLLFFLWVASAFDAAVLLGARPVRFKASSVIVGFMVPFLNLFRPFQGLRALDDAIEPAVLPEPRPVPETGEHGGGYREAALAGAAAAADTRRPPLLAWWALWIGGSVLSLARLGESDDWMSARTLDAIVAASEALCAALAIVVVHRIGSRLQERARRLAAKAADAPPQ